MTAAWCNRCGRYVQDDNYYDPVPEVVVTACRLWNVPAIELLSASRKRKAVAARQPVMAVLYDLHDMTLADIGAALDRDHTTILHGIRQADPDRVAQLTEALSE